MVPELSVNSTGCEPLQASAPTVKTIDNTIARTVPSIRLMPSNSYRLSRPKARGL